MLNFACPVKSVFFIYPGFQSIDNSARQRNWAVVKMAVRAMDMNVPSQR